MITLGIETSCDDTALALIETKTNEQGLFQCRVISSLVHSQAELHSAYGGVFPTLAKREHGKNIVSLLHKLLSESKDALNEIVNKNKNLKLTDEQFKQATSLFKTSVGVSNPDLWESLNGADFLKDIPAIDRIAVTEGPGLEPALWVGIIFARILGHLWNVPIVPVNHMEGHILGSLLESDKPFGTWQELKTLKTPALALLISGGHTELVKIDAIGKYEIIGQTRDDAVGEAFDKTARLLGLPYPGGPHVSKYSEQARDEKVPSPVSLPRPMLDSDNLDFSFSGLKTAVLYAVREKGTLDETWKKGLCLEFEETVAEVLETKLRMAIDQIGAQTLIIGGGVSANKLLRERFKTISQEYDIPLHLPTQHISGDNALMIAIAGALSNKVKLGAELKAHGTKRLTD